MDVVDKTVGGMKEILGEENVRSHLDFNQQQMAELYATSKPNISMHISNILKDKELAEKSVVKKFLTTATDGKSYNVVFGEKTN